MPLKNNATTFSFFIKANKNSRNQFTLQKESLNKLHYVYITGSYLVIERDDVMF